MATPDKGIPQDLLEKAHCIIIVPGMKQAAFVVGGKFGRGYAVCRRNNAGWGAPAAVRVEGGSFGFQIGGSSHGRRDAGHERTRYAALAGRQVHARRRSYRSGGTGGPEHGANTDAQLSAEILSWSRSKGLFAGIALQGATLRPDNDMNQELYGAKLTNKEILNGNQPAPASSQRLIAALDKYSFRENSADRDKH